jgi:hypothetical protein
MKHVLDEKYDLKLYDDDQITFVEESIALFISAVVLVTILLCSSNSFGGRKNFLISTPSFSRVPVRRSKEPTVSRATSHGKKRSWSLAHGVVNEPTAPN